MTDEPLLKIDFMKATRSKIPLDQIPEVREMLSNKIFTTVLNPVKVSAPLPQDSSKFGGAPIHFETKWPDCPLCQTKLTFVLQLLKKDFPTFAFKADTDVMQLFRCDNEKCPQNYGRNWDHLVAFRFRNLSQAQTLGSTNCKSVPECQLQPNTELDYPSYWEGMFDWWGETFESFDKKYRKSGEFDEFCDTYRSIEGTKIGGFPAWQQIPDFPVCKCGKRRRFLFQLASGSENGGEPHGICIGDAGNIYFFICEDCWSIETRWDCG